MPSQCAGGEKQTLRRGWPDAIVKIMGFSFSGNKMESDGGTKAHATRKHDCVTLSLPLTPSIADAIYTCLRYRTPCSCPMCTHFTKVFTA